MLQRICLAFFCLVFQIIAYSQDCYELRSLDDELLRKTPYTSATTIPQKDDLFAMFIRSEVARNVFTEEKLGTPECNNIWKIHLRDAKAFEVLVFTTSKSAYSSGDTLINGFIFAFYSSDKQQYLAFRSEKYYLGKDIMVRPTVIREKIFDLDGSLIEEIDYDDDPNPTDMASRDDRPICFKNYKTCMRWFAAAQEDDWLCDWLPCTTMNTLACKGSGYYGWLETSSNFVGAGGCKCGTVISSAAQQPGC